MIGAGVEPRRDARQIVLCGREDHADRIEFGDDDDAGRVRRLQVVAGVDEPDADPPVDRRHDARIVEVELGRLNLRLIGLNRRLVLRHQRLLVGHLLLGDRVLLGERFVAFEVALRLGEQRLVLGELALRLGERGLIGPGVDLDEEVAFLDHLAFGEAQLHQGPGDLGLEGYGCERRHRSERVEGDRHVANGDWGDAHRLRHRPEPPLVGPLVGRLFDRFELLICEHGRSRERHDDGDAGEQAAPPRRWRFRVGRGRRLVRPRRQNRRRALGHLRFEHFVHAQPRSDVPQDQGDNRRARPPMRPARRPHTQ